MNSSKTTVVIVSLCSLLAAINASAQPTTPKANLLLTSEAFPPTYSVSQTSGNVVIESDAVMEIESVSGGLTFSTESLQLKRGMRVTLSLSPGSLADVSVSAVDGTPKKTRITISYVAQVQSNPPAERSAGAKSATTSGGVTTGDSVRAALQTEADTRSVREYQIDMPMTTSPALFVLGRSPVEIPRATSAREFVGQIARSIDANGNVSTSLVGEISAYRLLNKQNLNLGRYRDNYLDQVLSNTILSFATPTQKNDPTTIAFGLQTTWLDQLDVGTTDLPACVRARTSQGNDARRCPDYGESRTTSESGRNTYESRSGSGHKYRATSGIKLLYRARKGQRVSRCKRSWPSARKRKRCCYGAKAR
jgi:hypothetical protein